MVDECTRLLATGRVRIPVDFVIARDVSADAETRVVAADAIPDGWKGLDVGPATAAQYARVIADAATVLWNGPDGHVRARAVRGRHAHGRRGGGRDQAFTVVGGGDSAPRSGSSGSPIGSTMSVPAAARRSSSSSAATFPGSTHSARKRDEVHENGTWVVSDRMPIIAGNWKMHHDHFVAIQVVQKLSYRLEPADYEACEVVVCPPFTDLRTLQTIIDADKLRIKLGAQNCHWEDSGAYTGEVSPPMLAKLRVSYVIIGHSERRQLFGETDETVNKKLKAVIKHGMTPIVCVGETLDEREAGATADRVTGQIQGAFDAVKASDAGSCVVAYEPIWAIGTGRNATPTTPTRPSG